MGKFFKKELTETLKLKNTFEKVGKAKSWKEILNEIYNSLPSQYGRGTKGIDDNHPLAKKLKISGFELEQCLMFLSDQKLIYYKENNWIGLTEKGFNIALENEKHKSNLQLQLTITVFTAFLVITNMFNFFLSLKIYDSYMLLYTYTLLLLVVFFIVKRKLR